MAKTARKTRIVSKPRAPRGGLVAEINELYDAGLAVAEPHREQALVNEAYVHGDQWDLIITEGGKRSRRKDAWYDDEEIPRVAVNEIGPAHQTWAALMTKDRPTVEAAPTNDSPESAYKAAIGNVIIEFLEEELNSANVVYKATSYAGMHGSGGIKIVYDAKLNKLTWSVLTIFDFVIDPKCSDYRLAKWVIFEDFIDEDEALDDLEAVGSPKKPTMVEYKNAAGDALEGVRRLELWHKPCRKWPQGMYACVVDDVLVASMEEYPYVFEDDSGEPQYILPLVMMRMRDYRGGVYGGTNLSSAVPMQHGYNEMVSRISKEIRDRKTHLLLPDTVKNAMLSNDVALFFPKKDAIAAREARYLEAGNVPQAWFDQRDFFRGEIPVVIGLNEVTAGTESRALSGRAIDNIVELDQQKNADATREQLDMVSDAWQLSWRLVGRYYSDMRKAKIANADPGDVFAYNGTDVAGADVRLDPANELDKTAEARKQGAAQDMQNGVDTSLDVAKTRTDGSVGFARQQSEQIVQQVLDGQPLDIGADEVNVDVLSETIAKYMSRSLAKRDRGSWLRLEQLRRQVEQLRTQADNIAPQPGAPAGGSQPPAQSMQSMAAQNAPNVPNTA